MQRPLHPSTYSDWRRCCAMLLLQCRYGVHVMGPGWSWLYGASPPAQHSVVDAQNDACTLRQDNGAEMAEGWGRDGGGMGKPCLGGTWCTPLLSHTHLGATSRHSPSRRTHDTRRLPCALSPLSIPCLNMLTCPPTRVDRCSLTKTSWPSCCWAQQMWGGFRWWTTE